MLTQFTGLLWFLLMLAPLIALQRILHREIRLPWTRQFPDPG